MGLVLKPLIKKTSEEMASMDSDAIVKMNLENSKIADENQKSLQAYAEKADKDIEELEKALKAQGLKLAEMQLNGGTTEIRTFGKELKKEFDKHIESLKGFSSSSKIQMQIKGYQTYGDIDQGSDFAQMRTSITDLAVPKFNVIRSLFSVIPATTEFYKYPYQNVVVRDAKNVAKCAVWVDGNTKEQIKVGSIETKVVKDIIKFCRKFIADYPFMQNRVRKLILESVGLRIDNQLLLGDGTGENIKGIDSYASEFDALNPDALIGPSVELATYVDLLLAMRTQISVFGQENLFMADTVLVNVLDWFTLVESRKDTQGNYIDSRVTMVNGMPMIGGMRVISHPFIAKNTCYVFDSSKGEILDRQEVELEIALMNADEWESEIASMKASERLNLLVIHENSNAFMKCSDVLLGISAITKS